MPRELVMISLITKCSTGKDVSPLSPIINDLDASNVDPTPFATDVCVPLLDLDDPKALDET